jgi:hypothetical protein
MRCSINIYYDPVFKQQYSVYESVTRTGKCHMNNDAHYLVTNFVLRAMQQTAQNKTTQAYNVALD